MNQNDSDKAFGVIDFYNFVYRLKSLPRAGWLRNNIPPEKCESVAEHTLGMAALALYLMDQFHLDIDKSKVLMMIIIHDLGEVIVGDITPKDEITVEDKFKKELEAINEIFNSFNEPDKFISLWKEFETNNTPEARFVKQLDKLEMALQAKFYEKELDIDLNEFFESALDAMKDKEFKILIEGIKNAK